MTDEKSLVIPISERGAVEGNLDVPRGTRGAVLFAHGSGSSRRSPRNRYVAEVLQQSGMATLLVDLLTADEKREDRDSGYLRFNIRLLAHRLQRISDWFLAQGAIDGLPLGYFGASTGAAAALVAAAGDPRVRAIVSRGGRPDLAGSALGIVRAPTLLIVGGADPGVLALNRAAYERLHAEKRLDVIPGASHLFEEPGALARVAALAGAWFEAAFSDRNLVAKAQPTRPDRTKDTPPEPSPRRHHVH